MQNQPPQKDTTEPRNVLIVIAHPEPTSFNHALAAAMAAALRAAGHHVTLSDLAAEGFRADVGRHDMVSTADPSAFHVQAEQAQAARSNGFAPDIAREQARVASADLVIFQFPLWWGAPPALMKGWMDRVLSYGFAYVDGRRFDTGLLQGRRALLSVTTGGTPERFSESGVYGPIDALLAPMRRLTLEYMGFTVAPDCISHAVSRVADAARQSYVHAAQEAALAVARLPVDPSDAWRTALQDVPQAAWKRSV